MTKLNAAAITGETRLVGLLGYPVAHSISPYIHNAICAKLGLNFAYVPLSVTPDNIEKAVHGLRALGFAGANVTIPHKQAVMKLCDEVSPLSEKIGAVNTLYFRDGKLHGTTTDPVGFFGAVEAMGVDPAGKHVVILGNGGTARTIGAALLLEKNPASLVLAGRNESRLNALALDLKSLSDREVETALLSSEFLKEHMPQVNLLVNCTSAGMHPNVDQSPIDSKLLYKDMAVFDTVYNPSQTKLLGYAKDCGCNYANGLLMLLYQAYASFEYWTGVKVERDMLDIEEVLAQIGK